MDIKVRDIISQINEYDGIEAMRGKLVALLHGYSGPYRSQTLMLRKYTLNKEREPEDVYLDYDVEEIIKKAFQNEIDRLDKKLHSMKLKKYFWIRR